jgi:hypothetical protein
MKTLETIIKKLLDSYINKNSNCNFKNYLNILFTCFLCKNSYYLIENKYSFFYQTIDNPFISIEIKEEFINFFCSVQKTYFAFSKLANLYKYKKSKIIIEYDLCLNPIKENGKNVFCLLQNNNRYLFNVNDLIKIIHNSIANTCHFFNNPLPIKNPYNNVLINKSTLYNIYFYVRKNTFLNPDLFFYFFKTNFDIKKFTEKYQFLIRDYSIYNYLNSSTNCKLYEDLQQMIDNFNYTNIKKVDKIVIDDEFPKDLLIKIMKPYLHLYFLSEFSLIHASGRMKYKKKLRHKLLEFHKFNPIFGRKTFNYIKILNGNNIIKKTTFNFNSNHLQFDDKVKDKKCFMDSHNSKYSDDDDYDVTANNTDSESDDNNETNNNNDDDDNNDDDNNDDDNHEDDNNDNDDDNIEEHIENDNFSIIGNINNNFLYTNNNLYLINGYQTDEETTINEDELNNRNIWSTFNNINNNLDAFNNNLDDIDNTLNDIEDNCENDSFS